MINIIEFVICFLNLHYEHHTVSNGMVSWYLNLKKVLVLEAYCVKLNMTLFIEILEVKHGNFKSCTLIQAAIIFLL